MSTQIQTPVSPRTTRHGKHVAWLVRIANVVVILVGIFCGYSLESRHHASAAEMPAVRTSASAAYGTRGDASVCQYAATERLAQK